MPKGYYRKRSEATEQERVINWATFYEKTSQNWHCCTISQTAAAETNWKPPTSNGRA